MRQKKLQFLDLKATVSAACLIRGTRDLWGKQAVHEIEREKEGNERIRLFDKVSVVDDMIASAVRPREKMRKSRGGITCYRLQQFIYIARPFGTNGHTAKMNSANFSISNLIVPVQTTTVLDIFFI